MLEVREGHKKYIYYILTYTIEYLHISLPIAANWVFVFPNGKLMEEVKLAEYGCKVFRDKYYLKHEETLNKVLYFTSGHRNDTFYF
jgi:hypothetical protein